MPLKKREQLILRAFGYDPKTGKKIKKKLPGGPTAAEIAAMEKRSKARKAKGGKKK